MISHGTDLGLASRRAESIMIHEDRTNPFKKVPIESSASLFIPHFSNPIDPAFPRQRSS